MRNAKLILAVSTLLILTAGFAAAANVALIVALPNGTTIERCINTEEGTDGYKIFQKSGIKSEWSYSAGLGHFLKSVAGYSGSESDGYWTFFIYDYASGTWKTSPVGSDGGSCWNRDFSSYSGHYCAQQGDMLGWVRTKWDMNTYSPEENPPQEDFSKVCGLSISGITAYVDGSKKSGINDGDKISVRPGSQVQIEVKGENSFDDLKVEDASATVILEGIEDGDNIEVESEKASIRAGSEKTFKVSFQVPLTAEEGSYDLKIGISGDGSNGWEYKDEALLKLDLKKNSHKLIITSFTLSSNQSCTSEFVNAFFRIANIGRNQEDAKISIVDGQNVLAVVENVRIPAEDGINSIYSGGTTLKLENLTAGVHTLNLLVTYSGANDSEDAILEVRQCQPVQANRENNTLSQENTKALGISAQQEATAGAISDGANAAYASPAGGLSMEDTIELLSIAALALLAIFLVVLIAYIIKKM